MVFSCGSCAPVVTQLCLWVCFCGILGRYGHSWHLSACKNLCCGCSNFLLCPWEIFSQGRSCSSAFVSAPLLMPPCSTGSCSQHGPPPAPMGDGDTVTGAGHCWRLSHVHDATKQNKNTDIECILNPSYSPEYFRV